MSRWKQPLAAATLAVVLVLVELFIHETAHVVLNAVATGSVPSCGAVGPFTVYHGRVGVCYEEAALGAYNSLLTPVTMSALGVVSMYYSDALDAAWVRWGLFVAGMYAWVVESLYSMGYYTPPTLAASGVQYHGDGVDALAAFGFPAMLPGAILLASGILVLHRRLEYERGGVPR